MPSGCRYAARLLPPAAAAILAVTSCGASDGEGHWGYEGREGPDHWAELSPDFSACADGRMQSPIDLTAARVLQRRKFDRIYGEVALDVEARSEILDLVDNGHTIQVTPDARVGLDIDGEHFELAQFHFHSPSEHAIDGKRYPLEAHFVMSNTHGDLAVLGVLYEEGEHEPAFDVLITNLPGSPGEQRHLEGLELDIEALKPLPDTFFVYRGSLTTPPCSEGVRWFVMAEPESLSGAQLESLTSVLHGNARPLQPLNSRVLVLETAD